MAGKYIKPIPTIEAIRRDFDVDIERGTIFHEGSKVRAGSISSQGYILICMGPRHGLAKKQFFAASRLIWKVATGRDPRGVIDHINGIRDDNRLANLRDVTPLINAWNKHGNLWARTVEQRKKDAARLRKERKEKRCTDGMQRAFDHIPMGLGT